MAYKSFLASLIAIAAVTAQLALAGGHAHALPTGPATNACDNVTAVMDRLQEMGLDTTRFYDHVVSHLCPV